MFINLHCSVNSSLTSSALCPIHNASCIVAFPLHICRSHLLRSSPFFSLDDSHDLFPILLSRTHVSASFSATLPCEIVLVFGGVNSTRPCQVRGGKWRGRRTPARTLFYQIVFSTSPPPEGEGWMLLFDGPDTSY